MPTSTHTKRSAPQKDDVGIVPYDEIKNRPLYSIVQEAGNIRGSTLIYRLICS